MTATDDNYKAATARSSANGLQSLLTSETFLYIVKRVLQGLLTLLLASALSFAIIQLTPGGFLALLDLNPKISQETKEQYIALFGLKDPPIVQYFKWLWQVVTQFNFGLSFTYFRPVSSLLLERIPATLLMSLTSIILTWAIAIPLGILSAVSWSRFPQFYHCPFTANSCPKCFAAFTGG